MPETVCIKNSQCPGDYVVLTAALRDIALQYSDRFRLYAKVLQPDVFLGNPHVGIGKPLNVREIKAEYSSPRNPYRIHQSNQHRAHFMWGFLSDLNIALGTRAVLSDFRPALYLTEEEKATPLLNLDRPYWVFVSGGKRDYPAKMWDPDWWQVVSDRLGSKVVMVQVGGGSHIHPRIRGVHDLVAKTSFRELMRLIYHSHGVLCIVTCLAHIAAAFNKPCVVVAGSRESWTWEAYNLETRLFNMRIGMPDWQPPPQDEFIPQQYLHSENKLPCCMGKGCWKRRVEGGGELCLDVVVQPSGRRLPHCLQLITPDAVVDAFDWYYREGILSLDRKLIVPPIQPASIQPDIGRLPHAMTPIPDAVRVPARARGHRELPPPPPPPADSGPERDLDGIHLVIYVTSDAQQEYLNTVRERSPKAAVTVTCDGPLERIKRWCEHNAVGVVTDGAAPGRLELLVRALTARERRHVVWLEPPFLPRPGFWGRSLFSLGERDYSGCLYWKRLADGHKELVKSSPWGVGMEFQQHALDGTAIATYPARGWFSVPQRETQRLIWLCRHVPDADFETVLGASAPAWGLYARDLGNSVEQL